MDDIFDKTPASPEQPAAEQPVNTDGPQSEGGTRVMPALSDTFAFQPVHHRRRRTERNQEHYEESAAPAQPVKESPAATPEAAQTTAIPRFQTRYNPPVPGDVPSQGVPRPAALRDQPARRPVFTADPGEVRRPVQAEGYTPVQPLGRRVGTRENPNLYAQPAPPIMPRQIPQLDDDDEYEEPRRGKGLVIIIIVLLILAALVLGFLLIPEDMAGPVGDAKRAITGLFSSQKEETPPEAMSFTGVVNRDTAPYQITFNASTSTNVRNVRIVDDQGLMMDTSLLSSITNSGHTLYVLTMTLSTDYQGPVYLQIHDGEKWIDAQRQQMLTIGSDQRLKISDGSTTSAPVASVATTEPAATPTPEAEPVLAATEDATFAPTDVPALTTGEAPTPTPTLAPAATEFSTEVPTEIPTEIPAAAVMDEPTDEPTATPTATPTLATTPTPTVNVTATPTAEPTPTATPEPTPEPTAVPTATPIPTPEPTPKLEAMAAESASPKIITTQKIYKGTRLVENYQRAEDNIINMPAGDDYLIWKALGVTTFRGNAFRMNAASGTVKNPSSMTVLWQAEGGALEIKAGTRYGFGVYSQPAIVKWPKDIREMMDLNEGFREKTALKEVILSGQDGKVYFLDLQTGEPTRQQINIGFALRGAPTVHPLSYPVITIGQWSNKLPSKTGKTMGLYYYSLVDNSKLRLIDTLDDRAYNSVGAMDTSALIDPNSNTLIAIGTNGMLYTEKLDFELATNNGGIFLWNDIVEQASLVSHTKSQKESYAAVESSLAMYGSYAFYADMDGILRCVDTTTMTTVWAVDTGDAVRAAIALDLDTETDTLWLYTANTITNRSKNGDVTIRRFNAMTGEEDWALAVDSIRKYSGQSDSTGKDITAGAVASPIIGQNGLSDLVFFTLSSVSADGNKTLSGNAEKQPSVLVALNKEDGSVAWTLEMPAYSYSSPVAVYSEDGQGWVIQCCSNGTIYLMDGLTGQVVNTLQVAGIIEGSPAVYNDTMVFGTTGKGKSFVYAIKLQ